MKKAIICLVFAIILANQEHPTCFTGVCAIILSILAIYYTANRDKGRSNKE